MSMPNSRVRHHVGVIQARGPPKASTERDDRSFNVSCRSGITIQRLQRVVKGLLESSDIRVFYRTEFEQ